MEAGTGEEGVTPRVGAEGRALVPMQIYVQEGNSVLESCWEVGCKEVGLGIAEIEDSGQAVLVVGTGEAGTSSARDHSPPVPGMPACLSLTILLLSASNSDELGSRPC